MPNNAQAYTNYQRLRGAERPVEAFLLQGDYKKTNTEPSFQYFSKSRNFYKFGFEDSAGKVFHYLHREGYLPDPLSTTLPEKRKDDVDFLAAFPQFCEERKK